MAHGLSNGHVPMTSRDLNNNNNNNNSQICKAPYAKLYRGARGGVNQAA